MKQQIIIKHGANCADQVKQTQRDIVKNGGRAKY